MALVSGAGGATKSAANKTVDKIVNSYTGNKATVLTNGKSTSSPYTSNGGGNVQANSGKGLGTGVTTTQITPKAETLVKSHVINNNNKKDEDEKDIPVGGNNGDNGNNVNKITSADVQDTSEIDWLSDYYNTLMARYNEMVAKQKEANDLYYNKQANDINSRYGRLLRRLSKRAVDNGQDQYVTNAWNINYAKDTAQNNLAIERAKQEATNAENNYNNYNAIYNSLANSNASDAVKKKFYSNL